MRFPRRLIPLNAASTLHRVCSGRVWSWGVAVMSEAHAVLRQRRGATAVTFAVTALTIFGFVGLATEGGMWYLGRRDTQNAADAAAMAGALAIAAGADATASATSVAAQNGYSNAGSVTVAVSVLNATGTNPYNPVQVTVSEGMTPLISSLFTGAVTTVGGQATAVVQSTGTACALSLSGDLTVSGTYSTGCALASNSSSTTAINVTGSATAATFTSFGGCCGSGTVSYTARPPAPYRPVVTNPYKAADALTFTVNTCVTPPAPDLTTGVIWLSPHNTSGNGFCADIVVNTGDVYKVLPGTYFFKNASLILNGGQFLCGSTCSVTRNGMTFVFTGDTGSIGTVTIGSGATVTLAARRTVDATADGFPALAGLLFYGRGLSPVSLSQQNASGIAPIVGGIYFPNAALSFTGNTASPSACIVLIAKSVALYSNSHLAATGCGNTARPLIQSVRLTQ